MLSRYDISILQDLPIEQVAEDLGLHVIRHKAICPFHDDTRRNRYRCYVCDSHGGVIDLVMETLGKDFLEACRWLGADTDVKERRVFTSRPKPKPQETKPDIEYLSRLMCQPVINEAAARFLFGERKLSPEVIRRLGISSISYSCPMSSSPSPTYYDGPALLIPYRDIDGNLISVQSRYLGTDDKPRFRFPKGSRCTIFNLDSLRDSQPSDPIFITEGVTDCLAVLSAGFHAIAIPSATLLSENDKQKLSFLASTRTFHMYPDADEPGERLFLQLSVILPKLVRHRLPEGFKDIGQYYAHIKR